MAHLPAYAVVTVLMVLLQATYGQVLAPQETSLCVELIRPRGYPCTELNVTTTDGFILGLQRIPYGVTNGPNSPLGPPVFLMHGLNGGGDNWFLNVPMQSLGFVLADAGYDVYIGNNRNIRWSRGATFPSSDPRYWDWTFDELAAFDIPAFVNYIYTSRGNSKVFYVGHSQGTLTFFAGLVGGGPAAVQMKDKIRAAVLLAPFIVSGNTSAPILKATFEARLDVVAAAVGGPSDNAALVNLLCLGNTPICETAIDGFTGTNSYINNSRIPFYLKYFPQPTSARNINHFGQLYRSSQFIKYDRGLLGNQQKYGQATPPLYPIEMFPSASFQQLLFTGGIDQLATPADTVTLLQRLPNVNRQVVNFPLYGHLDFVIGTRAYIDIYPRLISFLRGN